MAAGRIASVDGLRGLAAFVVVIHHALLVSPAMAAAYENPRRANSDWAWWLTYTPLHIIWNGPAAVYVFFVLSGYVLARPVAANRIHWVEYYPKRLVRLYTPVAGATLLAALCISLVERPGGTSWWVLAHDPLSASAVVSDLLLLKGSSVTNTVLWSLRWEVWFSLLLPLCLIFGRRFSKVPLPILWILLAGLCIVGLHTHPALIYLPMFGCGVTLAYATQSSLTLGRKTSLATTLLVLWGLNATWLVSEKGAPHDAAFAVEVLSACGLVWLASNSGVSLPGLTNRITTWLGSRSFSLYLVHEPIIVTIAILAGASALPVVITVAIPGSLIVAELFYRSVERPSIRAAQWLGGTVQKRVDSRLAKRNAPTPAPKSNPIAQGVAIPRR